ncbi:MAG: outer membrane protein transport protein [Myxococcales bacterium]|nr:outer membrane protein transport protein [Myxococcales bacterium]
MKRLRHPKHALLTALVLAAPLALAASEARGAGFAINEFNARGLGMANAVGAIANTPAAAIFNPAGLVQLRGLSFQANVSLVAPQFAYTATPVPGQPGVEAEVEAERQFFPVPSLFAAYRIHDRVSAGIGVYARFGLGVTWQPSVNVGGTSIPWWGRSTIQEVDLQTVWFTPTVSIKLHERVLLGGGLSIVQGAVYLKRQVVISQDPADDVQVELSGDDIGFTGSAGLLIKAIPGLLHFGFTYRGGVSLSFDGQAAFTKGGSASAVPAALRTVLVDGPGGARLELPHQFGWSLAAFPMKGLSLGFSLEVTTWSSYKELAIEFANLPDAPLREQLSSSETKNWRNSITLRIGGEYRILPQLPVRLGFVYDQSPAPTNTVGPELPDADRYIISTGVGYEIGAFAVDLAYQFLLTGENETTDAPPITGRYGATAHILALGLQYRFDI